MSVFSMSFVVIRVWVDIDVLPWIMCLLIAYIVDYYIIVYLRLEYVLCDNKKIGVKICKLKNLMYFCALFHRSRVYYCCCSSVVEHFLGKEEVTSSSLVNSSKEGRRRASLFCFLYALWPIAKSIASYSLSPWLFINRVNDICGRGCIFCLFWE